MNSSQDFNRSNNNSSRDSVSSSTSTEGTKDYISGDSTPSSSAHQFPWIATNPKKESKKSAQKTNNT